MTKEEIRNSLDSCIPRRFLTEPQRETLISSLAAAQADPVPYLTWLLETFGNQQFKQKLVTAVDTYQAAAAKAQQQLPQEIVNAGEIFSKLSENALDSQQVTEVLQEMCPKHALYFLFATAGMEIEEFKEAAKKYLSKFPHAIDNLPEDFKAKGKALLI